MTYATTVAAAAVETELWLACDDLLLHHTNPWELDEALLTWGFMAGPCEAQDHVGVELVRERLSIKSSVILDRMVSEGRLGKAVGVGYYRYPGGGGAVVDPLIEDLILEEARFAKIGRSDVTDQTIIDGVTACLSTCLSRQMDRSEQTLEDIAVRLHMPLALLRSV